MLNVPKDTDSNIPSSIAIFSKCPVTSSPRCKVITKGPKGLSYFCPQRRSVLGITVTEDCGRAEVTGLFSIPLQLSRREV